MKNTLAIPIFMLQSTLTLASLILNNGCHSANEQNFHTVPVAIVDPDVPGKYKTELNEKLDVGLSEEEAVSALQINSPPIEKQVTESEHFYIYVSPLFPRCVVVLEFSDLDMGTSPVVKYRLFNWRIHATGYVPREHDEVEAIGPSR